MENSKAYYISINLFKISPIITWKIINIPNGFMTLSKQVSRQNAKSISWLILATCDRVMQERI